MLIKKQYLTIFSSAYLCILRHLMHTCMSLDHAFDARTSPLHRYRHLCNNIFQIHSFDYRSNRLHSENHLKQYTVCLLQELSTV